MFTPHITHVTRNVLDSITVKGVNIVIVEKTHHYSNSYKQVQYVTECDGEVVQGGSKQACFEYAQGLVNLLNN